MSASVISLIDKLEQNRILSREEFVFLLQNAGEEAGEYIREKAAKAAKRYFGNKVYTRGLIEFTNYCRNDCYYCGIRRSNRDAERYRLTKEDILECCATGYGLGFRTFVLQGGEDGFFTDDVLCDIVRVMKRGYPDCAITLSLGERDLVSYKRLKEAGADRYLLRHETADEEHYRKLHPENLSLRNRMDCLMQLKELGYQVGTGFMVGSPYQTEECLAEDLAFIHRLSPQMIGIGPYLPHHQTPFREMEKGSYRRTLFLISVLRLMIPNALIPATTALGTIHPQGREEGIRAGANVVMPNLSPVRVRKKYELYDEKICTGEEAAECRFCLQSRIQSIGYELVSERGDFVPLEENEEVRIHV